ARAGWPAFNGLGPRPGLKSANRGNSDPIRAEPCTSTKLRFIFPASSANTRRSMILSARRLTALASSSPAAPTNNTNPWPMVARCSVPPSSQLTRPEAARCATTRNQSTRTECGWRPGSSRPSPRRSASRRLPGSRPTPRRGSRGGGPQSSPAPLSPHPRGLINLRAEMGLGLDEGVDVAKTVVAVLQQLRRRFVQERLHVAIQRPVQRLRRRIVVRAGASLRLRHDLLDHAHRHDLARGQLQLLRGLDLAGVVAPHDGGGG